MKKKLVSMFMSAFFLLTPLFSVSANAENGSTQDFTRSISTSYQLKLNSSASEVSTITRQFMELQDKIDALLTISNGKYVYDSVEITNLVISENFNFEALNSEIGTNYTEETFILLALDSIETTTVETLPATRGTYCNRNYSTGGWNYTREFADNNRSGLIADGAERVAINWGLGTSVSTITAFIPFVGSAIATTFGIVGGFGVWYFDTFASSIRVNMSGCGTVIDINKFSTVFTIWDQREFYE